MKAAIKTLTVRMFRTVRNWERQLHMEATRKRHGIPDSVQLDHDVDLSGDVTIGEHTYINGLSRFASYGKSRIRIGRYCEIGRYVHAATYTHAFERPTGTEDGAHLVEEADIVIGDYVWIGDKVFIKYGVTIGDYAVIGANSVVSRDVEPFEIVAGAPIRHVRFNTRHERYREPA